MKKILLTQLSEEELDDRINRQIEKRFAKMQAPQEKIVYKTRKEASEKLHVTLPTLNEYTKSGLVKSYKIGGRVLYRDDELDAALSSATPIKYRPS